MKLSIAIALGVGLGLQGCATQPLPRPSLLESVTAELAHRQRCGGRDVIMLCQVSPADRDCSCVNKYDLMSSPIMHPFGGDH